MHSIKPGSDLHGPIRRPPADGSRGRTAALLLVALLGVACGSGIGVVPRPLAELVNLESPSPHLTPERPWDAPALATRSFRGRSSVATAAAEKRDPSSTNLSEPSNETRSDLTSEADEALRNGLQSEAVGATANAEAWYLWAAARSWEALEAPGASSDEALRIYDRTVGRYVELAFASPVGLASRYAATPEGSVVLRFQPSASDLDPASLQSLLDAGNLEVHGLRHRYQRSGLGAPLIGVRHPKTDALTSFRPAAGRPTPLTAVLMFDPPAGEHAPRVARLLLLDPRHRQKVDAHDRQLDLAADFSAPLAYLAESVDPSSGLIRPDKTLSHKGLVLLEPYSPDKTPVLMIHGLRSNPLIWMDLTNALMGDDDLRDAYQVWHFSYPTGLPFLYAALLLRDQLDELRAAIALETGHDLRDNPAVVIGHSMGGLVAKALAVDSHDVLWQTVFPAAATELRGSRHDLELAHQTLELERSPLVARLVFLATPHHGSPLADSLVGRLGSALAGRPSELADAWRRLAEDNASSVAPGLLDQLRHGGPTSIRALSPEDPLLNAYSRLEPPATIPYHSIIGNHHGDATAESSDGVVTFASAHLAGAETEMMVPSSHSLYESPAAIDEVKRILELHLLQHERTPPGAQLAGLSPPR